MATLIARLMIAGIALTAHCSAGVEGAGRYQIRSPDG